MASLTGVEPVTSTFAGLRSIQLSYKDIVWYREQDLNLHEVSPTDF